MYLASRDEKTSLSESNLILQQATINTEQAKNYLGFWDTEMIQYVSSDPGSIRSGEIQWPENGVTQGFIKYLKK